MKRVLAIFIFLVVVFSLAAHDFNGEWKAKFELNEKFELGVVLRDVEIQDDKLFILGEEYEFKVKDSIIIFDGKEYDYGTRDNMIILYSLGDDYKFDRILFLKPLKK